MKKITVVLASMILGLIAMPAMADLTALQGILDGITVPPPSSVNVNTDAIPETFDYHWQIGGSGGALSTLVYEVPQGDDIFGLYDAANPATKVQLLPGSAVPGDQGLVSILADGSVKVNFVDTGIDFLAGNNFGFYLTSANGTFYSDSALNNGGIDHMLAFQGTGDTIQLPGLAQGPWTANEYILAWEDGEPIGALAVAPDSDFADFVVLVESVAPVPVPAAVLLGLLGLGAAGLKLRRFA
jgi:hypothetical protein